ncbi:MAG: N-acetylmuramoyl-L-alanine amidase [Clostridia bacterium]|nr:N-acetylmuramoyl-L-alanine amidase [Clostridia bacterium]
MKSFVYQIVTKKLENLRICTLIVLCALAVCLVMERTAVEPADAQGGALSGMTIAVDPGHGGYDGGARARDSGRWEKELTLEIALTVEQALEARGARVVLTRREDVCLSDGDTATKARKRADLQRRLDIADEAGADVFLSIHLNEYRDRAESGPQVFYQKGGDAGRLLAGVLQQALIDGLDPQKQRRAMAGDYYVLRGKLPSALVECGFLSNAREEKLLMDAAYQNRIAQAVADGMENYANCRQRLEK